MTAALAKPQTMHGRFTPEMRKDVKKQVDTIVKTVRRNMGVTVPSKELTKYKARVLKNIEDVTMVEAAKVVEPSVKKQLKTFEKVSLPWYLSDPW